MKITIKALLMRFAVAVTAITSTQADVNKRVMDEVNQVNELTDEYTNKIWDEMVKAIKDVAKQLV